MGDLYEAACSDCGYRSEELQDGVGFTGTFLEPMICDDCGELVSVVAADFYSGLGPDLNACPRCSGGHLTGLPKLTLEEQASAGAFRLRRRAECPRCGGELAITPTGHWG
jgi:hypothetical protein